MLDPTCPRAGTALPIPVSHWPIPLTKYRRAGKSLYRSRADWWIRSGYSIRTMMKSMAKNVKNIVNALLTVGLVRLSRFEMYEIPLVFWAVVLTFCPVRCSLRVRRLVNCLSDLNLCFSCVRLGGCGRLVISGRGG